MCEIKKAMKIKSILSLCPKFQKLSRSIFCQLILLAILGRKGTGREIKTCIESQYDYEIIQ